MRPADGCLPGSAIGEQGDDWRTARRPLTPMRPDVLNCLGDDDVGETGA